MRVTFHSVADVTPIWPSSSRSGTDNLGTNANVRLVFTRSDVACQVWENGATREVDRVAFEDSGSPFACD